MYGLLIFLCVEKRSDLYSQTRTQHQPVTKDREPTTRESVSIVTFSATTHPCASVKFYKSTSSKSPYPGYCKGETKENSVTNLRHPVLLFVPSRPFVWRQRCVHRPLHSGVYWTLPRPRPRNSSLRDTHDLVDVLSHSLTRSSSPEDDSDPSLPVLPVAPGTFGSSQVTGSSSVSGSCLLNRSRHLTVGMDVPSPYSRLCL